MASGLFSLGDCSLYKAQKGIRDIFTCKILKNCLIGISFICNLGQFTFIEQLFALNVFFRQRYTFLHLLTREPDRIQLEALFGVFCRGALTSAIL
jgi:hypothetical protein